MQHMSSSTSGDVLSDAGFWAHAFLSKDATLEKERTSFAAAREELQVLRNAETSRKHEAELQAAVAAEKKRSAVEIDEFKKRLRLVEAKNESKPKSVEDLADPNFEDKPLS